MSENERNLGMPLAIARKNLREDPHTEAIAKELGVDIETYIDKVLEYALNPDQEPELEVLDEDAIPELDPTAATMNEVMAWLEGVESGEISLEDRVQIAESDDFSTDADRSELLKAQTGAETSPRRAPTLNDIQAPKVTAPDGEAGSVLRAQLLERQQSMRLNSDAQRAGARKPPSPRSRR